MVEIRAMAIKRAVIPLPQDPGLGFYGNLLLVPKVTGGGGVWPVINLKPLNQFLHNLRVVRHRFHVQNRLLETETNSIIEVTSVLDSSNDIQRCQTSLFQHSDCVFPPVFAK